MKELLSGKKLEGKLKILKDSLGIKKKKKKESGGKGKPQRFLYPASKRSFEFLQKKNMLLDRKGEEGEHKREGRKKEGMYPPHPIEQTERIRGGEGAVLIFGTGTEIF